MSEDSIQVRPVTDADRARWDAFVEAQPGASPYHLFAWKLAMEAAYRVETHYRIAESGAGEVLGILPAARVPRPIVRGPLCSLPYCDRGEPLAMDESIAQRLLGTLHREVLGRHEIRSTETSPSPTGAATASDRNMQSLATVNFEPGEKVRLLLDLPDNSEALFSGFKAKHRSQIRKAMKNGLEADLGNERERVSEFFEVFCRNMRDLGSPTHSRRWFEMIAKHYGERCIIGLVRLEDKVIGGGIVLRCGNGAAIPWASTLREYNHLAPNMLLYWTLLAHCADTGVRHFDFGRSSYGEGTYRFKVQWGAMAKKLRWEIHAASRPSGRDRIRGSKEPQAPLPPLRTKWWSATRSFAQSAMSKLPVPISMALGSRLRPFISL